MLKKGCEELTRNGYAVLISDADGVLLHVDGDDLMSTAMRDLGVIPGSCWREQQQGTNAIGEVLRTRQAAQVIGAAHFHRTAHVLACYAAPIFGVGGELIGVLDASTWLQRGHPLAATVVNTIANTMSRPMPQWSDALSPSSEFSVIAGADPVARETVRRAERLADSRIPLLITGETGTGKEILARAIHQTSRRSGPLVSVSASTLHDGSVEAELFGSAEGALSGARKGGSKGLVERAHRGTLLIDEVAQLSPRAQSLLLRFLDDGCFRRLGSTRSHQVDVRIIASTWEDLSSLVLEGRFRKDLFYRLNGAVLELPALRNRRDRVALAEQLLQQLSPGARLLPCEKNSVSQHSWPGNIRELKSLLALREQLGPGYLPLVTELESPPVARDQRIVRGSMSHAELRAVVDALRACSGNRAAAARRLGIARSTLYRLIDRYGL